MDQGNAQDIVENVTHLPVEQRMAYFQQKLAELIHKTDIEPIPNLAYAPRALLAEIVIIDLQNPEMLKKYGREKVEKTPEPASPPDVPPPPPPNPRLN